MACNGCNASAPVTKEQVENLINKLLDSGKLAGALKDCDGNDLQKGAKVLLCSSLADAVKKLVDDGTIKTIKDVKIEKGKLVVTDGTGEKTETDLPYVKAVASEKSVILTLPDGTNVEVPKAGSALTEDSFDHTITKGANVQNKFGVKVKENGGLSQGLDGLAVKTGDGLEVGQDGKVQVKTGNGLTTNSDGSLGLDGAKVKDAVGDGLAGNGLTFNNGSLNVATVRLMDASGTVHLGNLVDLGA